LCFAAVREAGYGPTRPSSLSFVMSGTWGEAAVLRIGKQGRSCRRAAKGLVDPGRVPLDWPVPMRPCAPRPTFEGKLQALGLRLGVALLSPRSNPSRYALGIDLDWQLLDAADEVGVQPPRRSHHLDVEVAGEDFFPEYSQLQVCQSVADTAVNTCAV
jgi:hypothetical protein